MIVLALDSSAAACSVALVDGDRRLIAGRSEPMARGHAEKLMPMIDSVLREARLGFAALGLIAVTTGPGSFTGIRVGLAAARGLGLASGVPVIGVSAFAAIAAAIGPHVPPVPLLVAIDSKRAELFIQAFGPTGVSLLDPVALLPGRLPVSLPPGDYRIAGDGALVAQAALADAGWPAALAASDPPAAPAVALAGLAQWRSGETPAPPRPFYLRAPEVSLPRQSSP